jgi:hypothetical protein
MWLRQTFFRWLIPAAFVLPLWLVVGWIVFGASPWALLWVLLSAPIVFVWQLILALLVRARGTVRAERAVSWTDAGLIGAWHLLVVALGVFDGRWWWPALAVTVVLGVVALSSSLRQLWRETGPRVDPAHGQRGRLRAARALSTRAGRAPRRSSSSERTRRPARDRRF